MIVRFVKAHGAGNDFLLIESLEAAADYAALARGMCDRHAGVGADGLIVFTGPASIRLFNSDGSEAELSGNGTRCAAAVRIAEGRAASEVTIETLAGPKRLRLLDRQDDHFVFEMNMGRPGYRQDEVDCVLETSRGPQRVTILDVGNPQCALLVESLAFDWEGLGREIEGHARFPRRTNVSFLQIVDRHTVEARFYERGAGPTLSSGTGSTGAAAAAILWGRAESPVRVVTQAGDLDLEWRDGDMYLRGPAEIVARGEFHWRTR